MTTLYMTRKEIIDDLPRAFREQNDLESMSDTDLAAAWVSQGTHAGTWEWDDIRVNRVYYNAEMGEANMLSMFRDMMIESMQYRQIAYLGLSDSSSLVEIESPAGNRRYAIGYQGDDTLHLLSDAEAEGEMEQASGADWHHYYEGERVFVRVDEPVPTEEFDAWASEYLTQIEYFADEYGLDKLNDEFSTQEGEYLVIEFDSEDTPEYPHIPQTVWNDLEAYDDGIFSEITSGQAVNLPTAILQLKMLRGRAVPEIGYLGHGFTGYDGMIMRVEQSVVKKIRIPSGNALVYNYH